MLKKILLGVAIFLFAANVKVSAAALINSDVERVIEGLQFVGSKVNVSIWGKEYLTIKDARICAMHWGNTKNNSIVFRLGNNNNVQRAIVSFPSVMDYDSLQSSIESGLMYGAILLMAGLSENDIENFGRKLFDDCMADPYAEYFNKTYTFWSSQTQRNIIINVEYKNNRAGVLMYAN